MNVRGTKWDVSSFDVHQKVQWQSLMYNYFGVGWRGGELGDNTHANFYYITLDGRLLYGGDRDTFDLETYTQMNPNLILIDPFKQTVGGI